MSIVPNYFSKFTSMTSNEVKGFKVANVNRTKKIGVACRDFKELKQKACLKFNIPVNEDVKIFLMDGSEVDDEYFKTLEPQSNLIIKRPREKLLTDADLLYDLLRKVNESYLQSGEKAAEFMNEKLKVKLAVLNKAINNSDDNKTVFSRREDHPEWFDGLDTNASTKEAYLHRRCQDRIRGYLYKTIEQIKSSEVFINNANVKKSLLKLITFFKLQLKQDHYFGHYFDRSRAITNFEDSGDETDAYLKPCYEHCPCQEKISPFDSYILEIKNDNDVVDARKISNEPEEKLPSCYELFKRNEKELTALCDTQGQFKCNGQWNNEKCLYRGKHKINPYRSKEELILFSTWNLDHRIERSRTLVPQILEASKKGDINKKDVIEFYNNLFTSKNLRLVHIVCHDKGSHK